MCQGVGGLGRWPQRAPRGAYAPGLRWPLPSAQRVGAEGRDSGRGAGIRRGGHRPPRHRGAGRPGGRPRRARPSQWQHPAGRSSCHIRVSKALYKHGLMSPRSSHVVLRAAQPFLSHFPALAWESFRRPSDSTLQLQELREKARKFQTGLSSGHLLLRKRESHIFFKKS